MNGINGHVKPIEDEYEEMTINEIINGKGDTFPGLLGLVYLYINSLNIDITTRCELERYLNLVKGRADGEHSQLEIADEANSELA